MNETWGENYESHDRLDKFLKCLARPMSWDLCSAARLGIRNHEKLREILFVLWTPFLFPSSFFFSSPNLYRETNKFFINFFQRFSIWADRYLRIVDDLFSLRLLPSLLQKSFTVWFVFLGKQRWNLFRLRCSLEEQVQVFFSAFFLFPTRKQSLQWWKRNSWCWGVWSDRFRDVFGGKSRSCIMLRGFCGGRWEEGRSRTVVTLKVETHHRDFWVRKVRRN